MAFKMKGQPFKRNFGVGASPIHSELSQEYYDTTGEHVGNVDLGDIENVKLRKEESRRRTQQGENIIKKNPDSWKKIGNMWRHKETNQTMREYVNNLNK